MNMDGNLCCIECGDKTTQLYKCYSSTVLKLNICDNCKNVVDRYIEYDNCIVFMDAFLQKIPAIRHIIFNSEFKAFWKLGILCLICDAYVKWDKSKTPQQRNEEFHLEWAFYFVCLCSIIDTCIFILFVSIYTRFINRLPPRKFDLVNAILFAKFGHLLIIPSVIWDLCHTQWYMWIRILFIIITNIQVHRGEYNSNLVTLLVFGKCFWNQEHGCIASNPGAFFIFYPIVDILWCFIISAVCLTNKATATAGIVMGYLVQSIISNYLLRFVI